MSEPLVRPCGTLTSDVMAYCVEYTMQQKGFWEHMAIGRQAIEDK